MFVQVSGRAGRKGKKGRVIIQTGDPEQVIFDKVIRNDYLEFYEYEILQRREHGYPPFMRVIRLTVKHQDQLVAERAAILLTQELVDRLGREAVKLSREHTVLRAAKADISEAMDVVRDQKEFKQVRIAADVDPM